MTEEELRNHQDYKRKLEIEEMDGKEDSDILMYPSLIPMGENDVWHDEIMGQNDDTLDLGGQHSPNSVAIKQIIGRINYIKKQGVEKTELEEMFGNINTQTSNIGDVAFSVTNLCEDGWKLWQASDENNLLIEDYQELVDSESPFITDVNTTSGTFTLKGHGGRYFRPAGYAVQAGETLGDAIRNIEGTISDSNSRPAGNGVFSNITHIGANNMQPHSQYAGATVKFDASTVVPTASENRPATIGVYVKIFIGKGNGGEAVTSAQTKKYGEYKIVPLDYSEDGWEEWEREESEAKNISDYVPLLSAYLNGNLEHPIISDYNPSDNTFKFVGNGGNYGNYTTQSVDKHLEGVGMWKARDWKQIDGVYQYDLNRLEIYDDGGLVHSFDPTQDIYSFIGPVTASNGKTYRRGNLTNDLSVFGAKSFDMTVDWKEEEEVKTMKVMIYTGVNI